MLDNAKITSKQFAFGVACIIQSSVLLTSFFIDLTKQDSWLVVIFGALLAAPMVAMYGWLMQKFPEKNLFQMFELLFGKVAGKIVCIIYFYFFFQLTSLNLHDIGNFMSSSIIPNTPFIVILVVAMFACAYAVRGDIGVIMKFSAAFMITTLAIFIFALILTVDIIEVKNFLPVFDQPPFAYLHSTHAVTTIPFAEVVVFLMITPNLSIKREKMRRYYLYGFFMGAMTLLLVVASSIALLGNSLSLFTLPPFEMFAIINLTSALSRMEILSAIAILMLLFFKVSLLYYISVVAIAHIFNLKKYKPLVYAFGAICVIYATFIYKSNMVHIFLALNETIFAWLIFELVFPLAAVIATLIRKNNPKIIEAMNAPPASDSGSLNNITEKPQSARLGPNEMEKTGGN